LSEPKWSERILHDVIVPLDIETVGVPSEGAHFGNDRSDLRGRWPDTQGFGFMLQNHQIDGEFLFRLQLRFGLGFPTLRSPLSQQLIYEFVHSQIPGQWPHPPT